MADMKIFLLNLLTYAADLDSLGLVVFGNSSVTSHQMFRVKHLPTLHVMMVCEKSMKIMLPSDKASLCLVKII